MITVNWHKRNTIRDWVGKGIHRKLCKRLKFDQAEKWYQHKFVLEKKTHKILKNFEIQTDHLIPARRPDLLSINKIKRTCHLVDFAVLANHRVKMKKKKKSEKTDKYLDLGKKQKNFSR